jgi:thiol-disulfide isomerase/thioredoxin
MTVTKITSMDDYNALLETSKTKLVVIDFSASWCGPCRFIHPIYEKMATENPDVAFAEVDVDETEDVRYCCDCDRPSAWLSVTVGACFWPIIVRVRRLHYLTAATVLCLLFSFLAFCSLFSILLLFFLEGRRKVLDPGHADVSFLQERGEDCRNDGSRSDQARRPGGPTQEVMSSEPLLHKAVTKFVHVNSSVQRRRLPCTNGP